MVACILAWCVGFAARGLEIGEGGFIVRFASRTSQTQGRHPASSSFLVTALRPLANLQALPSGAGETAPDEPPEPP